MLTDIQDRLKIAMGRRREPSTITNYIQIVEKFCRDTGKTTGWSRNELLVYFDRMIDKGYAYASLMTTFFALKSIFKYLNEPFEMEQSDLPRNDGRPQMRPMTSKDNVDILIAGLKAVDDKDYDIHKFYLAMSTVYGLRREEMARLEYKSFTVESVSPPKVTVFVNTAKHGIPRTHLVPVEIISVLFPIVQNQKTGLIPNNVSMISVIWNQICEALHYPKMYKESWHSVRRSLATELVKAGIPDPTISNFMRWKSPGGGVIMTAGRQASSMVNRYYSEEDEDIDRLVFSKHPYLETWK